MGLPAIGMRGAAGAVQDGRFGPGHLFHDHQPQRLARHVHPVAQRIGAQQAGVGIVAEDVDQRARVDRVDMLGIERQAKARHPVGDAAMHGAQPADRGEQAQRAAAARLDQPAIGAGQRRNVAAWARR
jgi:hypothetical protein